ncbi:biotin transporter BioY [Nocardioides sp. Soil796]|uniref:biotin transporter BioY n=1 Tax=Nocardioides sp. Soil796 TaxID=1736412 RepID=UPI00070E518F|nr:biotin transporter BioY [Nocardioides sp. Soil796]KRF19905.1 biotin biosynthesis protein BioY [Nocardioides sp. Soil796]
MSTTAIRPTYSPHSVLADVLPRHAVVDVAVVISGAALTGLAAQVAVHTPLSPVPFTLQTLSVLLVAAAVGPVRAVLTMALYLGAGAAGVPWFAQHSSGWGGPTFGYLLGFLAAALLVGALARRGASRNALATALTMVVGNAVVYAVGVTWLALSLSLDLSTALELGLWPFLVGDAVKLAVAAAALPTAWALLGRLDRRAR